MFDKKTVRDIRLTGKRVLLRADYNAPLDNGRITDDYRLKASLPTIEYILKQKPAALIIISHLGRPEGKRDKSLSLHPVATRLQSLLGKKVYFAADCIGEDVKQFAARLPAGGVAMFENVRFHPGEEKDDPDFAKAVVEAASAQLFVADGFGVVHRAHATTHAITRLLPSVAGLLLEKEVKTINQVMRQPERPLLALIGGAKISDKLDLLNKMLDHADVVAVAGALANDFLLAEKIAIGRSLVESKETATAEAILAKARALERKRLFSFLLPVDGVVSTDFSGKHPTRVVDFTTHGLADIEAYPHLPDRQAYTVGARELILDIGPASAAQIAGAIKLSRTVIWNGTCGVTETPGIGGASPPFTHGTRVVVEAMIGASNKHKNKPFTLVGGGDTVGYVESEGLVEDFNHVSTGGGAGLELMVGKKLPGVESLEDKK